MDKALIERLALEVGLTDAHLSPWMTDYGYSEDEICKFAALVAEECAKEAEKQDYEWSCSACSAAKNSAAAIRAKFSPN